MSDIDDDVRRGSWRRGAAAAASQADEYATTHPYRLSDCILYKLNLRDKKPRRNRCKLDTPQNAWVCGLCMALADMLRHCASSLAVCTVAKNAGVTLKSAKAAGCPAFDLRELKRAGVAPTSWDGFRTSAEFELVKLTASIWDVNWPKDGDHSGKRTRSLGALCNSGIALLGEIVQLSDKQLLQCHGLGPHCLYYLKGALQTMGLHTGMRLDVHQVKECREARAEWTKSQDQAFKRRYNQTAIRFLEEG